MGEYLRGFITTFAIGLMLSGLTGPDEPPSPGLTLDARCIRVIDGDTTQTKFETLTLIGGDPCLI